MTARATVRHEFELAELASPLGVLLAVGDRDGALRALEFADREARMRLLLRRQYGEGGFALRAVPARREVAGALAAYFAGELCALDALAVCTNGSPFQRSVWQALRAIPAGTTTTYGRAPRAPSGSRTARTRSASSCPATA